MKQPPYSEELEFHRGDIVFVDIGGRVGYQNATLLHADFENNDISFVTSNDLVITTSERCTITLLKKCTGKGEPIW